MFLIKPFSHIWKRVGVITFLAAWLLTLLVAATPARAADETYTWKSTTDVSSFTGLNDGDGDLTADATFTRQPVTTGASVTYTGSAQYKCAADSTTHTDNLTVTIAPSFYNNGKPVNPTIGQLTGATCAALSTTITVKYPGVDVVTGKNTDTPACDQGSLSWAFCPLIDNISSGISAIATSILTPLLEVNSISPSSTPQLYQVWTHIRDFANVLFILVFFAIIASTMLQQDIGGLNPYTIKSTWIRLIFAAILVQFSFYISGFIVDIGNVLGIGISTLIHATTQASAGQASIGNFVSTLVAGSLASIVTIGALLTISWPVIAPILVALIISIFIVLLTIGARFLLIAVLIVASPLAFLAFVLPNTRHYTSDWFKILLRLMLMFPLVIGIFSFAGVVNEILPFASSTTSTLGGKLAVAIISPLITIAAFLVIPETFKLAGKGLNRLSGLINGVSGKSRSWLKDTQMYKDGQTARQANRASRMQILANSEAVTAFTRSDSWTKRRLGTGFMSATGAAIGTSGTPVGIQKAYKNAQADEVKSLKDFDNISPGLIGDAVLAAYGDKAKLEKVRREAPVLLRYMNTLPGRAALAGRANEAGVFSADHVRQIRSSALSHELKTLQTTIDKNGYPEKGHLHRLDGAGLARDDMSDYAKGFTALSMDSKIDKGFWEAASGVKEKRADGTYSFTPDDYSKSITSKVIPSLTATEIGSFFNSNDKRFFGSRDKRLAILQWAATNTNELRADANGRAVLEAIRNGITVTSHTDNNRNRDLFGDFNRNIMNGPGTDVSGLDPQDSGIAQKSMSDDIINRLS